MVVIGVGGSQPRHLVHQNYSKKCVYVAAYNGYHLVQYERLEKRRRELWLQ